MKEGRLCIGTAGWSYPDWAGIVYPKGIAKGPEQLKAEYASYFD